MTESDKKRLSFLIKLVYYAVLIAIFYLIFKKFAGVLMPFIIATVIAIILRKPVDFFEKKTKQRGIASVLGVVLLVAIAGGLITLLGWGIVAKVKDFYDFLTEQIQHLGEYADIVRDRLLEFVTKLPASVSENATESINSFFDNFIENGLTNFSFSSLSINWSTVLSKGGSAVKDTVGQIPSLIVSVIITVISAIFLTKDFNKLTVFVKKQFSEEKLKKINDGIALTKTTFSKMVKAYSKLMAITFCEMSLGLGILWLLNIYSSPYLFIIAAATAVVDIIPVLGTGTVLIPWLVICLIGGRYPMAIGLGIMYVVIFAIRQVLEPKIVSGETGMSPIITIASMYIGTKSLGVLGFFILPLIVIVIKKFNEEGILNWFEVPENETEEAETLIAKLKRHADKKLKKKT